MPNAFGTVSSIYEENPSLDFSFGSSASFCNENKNILGTFYNNKPEEHKTTNAWPRYLNPRKEDYMWLFEYYEEPKSITSIIHASRANIMTVYHPYVIRKSSLSNLSEINNPTSIIFDDLEFFSMLEYRNLIYSSIKKVLIFSRIHSDIRRTKQTDFAEKINVSEEIERVRNLCDTYRPQDFTASTLDLEAGDSDEIDLENILDQTKKEIENKISQIFKI